MPESDVFKLVAIRPPQLPPPPRLRIGFSRYSLDRVSPLHRRVREVQGDDPRQRVSSLAADYLASNRYADTVAAADDGFGGLLPAVADAGRADTVGEARDRFGRAIADADEYLRGPGRELRDLLWDGLYANAIVPERAPEDRQVLLDGVRAIHFVERIVADDPEQPPLRPDELTEVRATLPADLIPPPPRTGQQGSKPRKKARARLRKLSDRLDKMAAAADDVRNTDRLYRQPPAAPDGCAPTSSQPVRKLSAHEFAASLQSLPDVAPEVFAVLPTLREFANRPAPVPWVFGDFGRANLRPQTREALEANRPLLQSRPAPEVADAIQRQIALEATDYVTSLSPVELSYVAGSSDLKRLARLVPQLPVGTFDTAPAFPTPTERGIRPLGIGDLLVVREELLRYATGEVAHIENVLQGESKSREHRRLRQTEEIVVVETEQVEESEKDLQTTERFELHREAEKTIQSDLEFAAGVTVSGSYGTVTFGAHADFATSTSRTESNRNATNYAKEVTERSVARILQRAREERTRRTLEEFEETNKHGIDNTGGAGHVVGLYRWVDKYYRAQVHNYGRRLMFEFIVPEPAAFFLHSQASPAADAPTPPLTPEVWGSSGYRKLRPDDLTEGTYLGWVSRYDVEDVKPFPPASVSVAMTFAESSGAKDNVPFGKAYRELQLPPGYRARDWSGSWGSMSRDDNWNLGIELFVVANGVEGVAPVSVYGSCASYAVAIKVDCDRKDETLRQWQLDTYTAIMNAYQRQLADYHERLAAASIQQGITIEGRNPGINRGIERDELRKASLRLLTDEYAHTRVQGVWRNDEQFDAMQPHGSYGYPEFGVGEAAVEGQIIQFFEQAFEWENLTYVFYPYFWGRKSRWLDIFPLGDPDPKFRDFLRAGAARVIVPVHPAYNETVLHYLATNEIWNGGQPPTLDSLLYQSIVDELRAAAGAQESEVVGEWEVKLPTSLVYLQQDAALPDNTDGDGDGDGVEDGDG